MISFDVRGAGFNGCQPVPDEWVAVRPRNTATPMSVGMGHVCRGPAGRRDAPAGRRDAKEHARMPWCSTMRFVDHTTEQGLKLCRLQTGDRSAGTTGHRTTLDNSRIRGRAGRAALNAWTVREGLPTSPKFPVHNAGHNGESEFPCGRHLPDRHVAVLLHGCHAVCAVARRNHI